MGSTSNQYVQLANDPAIQLGLAIGIGIPGGEFGQGGGLGASRGVSCTEDFFAGSKYSAKVLDQMEIGDFHAFPQSVEGFQGAGSVTKVIGSDGITREMLKIQGSYRGIEGEFEFIKEPDGTISHRFFNPNPKQ